MIYLGIIFLFMTVAFCEKGDLLPSETGKFFYADFRSFEEKNTNAAPGQHVVDALVGSSSDKMNMWISTNEYTTGVITSKCPSPRTCNVPNTWDVDRSSSKEFIPETNDTSEAIVLYNGRELLPITFKGAQYKDKVTLQYVEFDRQTKFQNQILAIQESSQKFTSMYNGYIGIAPYAQDYNKRKENFLWQLKQDKKIDHMIVSFYVKMESGNSSIIKFGSYDKLALKEGSELDMFETRSVKSWDLIGTKFYLGDILFSQGSQNVSFDPQLPYIYMKDPGKRNQFKNGFLQSVMTQYGNTALADINDYWFKIMRPCSEITTKLHDFKFTLNDGTKSKDFTIPGHEMLIDSQVFGQSKGACYSAVFYTQDGGRDDVWYIGNLFMNKYYTVFDQTQYDEYGKNMIQIGIGEKRTEQLIGEQHYDPDSNYYDPEDEKLDQSTDINGIDDPYDSFRGWMKQKITLIIVCGTGFIFIIFTMIIVCCCIFKKKRRLNQYAFKTYTEIDTQDPSVRAERLDINIQ